MAQRGTPLAATLIVQAQAMRAAGVGKVRIARQLGLSVRTVRKYAPRPEGRRLAA